MNRFSLLFQVGVPASAALAGAVIGGILPAIQEDKAWERAARQEAYAHFYGVAQSYMSGEDMCTDVSDDLYEAVLGIDLYGSAQTASLAYQSIWDIRQFRQHYCGTSRETADRDGDGRMEGPATETLIDLVDSMRNDLDIIR